MGSIFSYLCCGCCCGNRGHESRQVLRQKQRTNLGIIKEITHPSKPMDNPLTIKTTEMTDIHKIPTDNVRTEADVLKQLGYKLGKHFDTGGFATVHECVHIGRGLKVALKKVPIPQDNDPHTRHKRISLLTDIKNELYVLQKCDHPNVVKMIEHFIIQDSHSQMTFYIVMQYAVGGNLSNKMDESGPFSERQCKRWFAQMLSGLNYMHSIGIAHRDLKLGNILLDEVQDLLISDFGLSRLVFRESEQQFLLSKTYCGTPPYMAPEDLEIPQKKKEQSDSEYNAFYADVWSLGIILFKLFNNRLPFSFARGPAKAVMVMKAKKWKFARVKVPPSSQFKDIMSKLLEPNPELRIRMPVLIEHSWIRNQFKSVESKNRKKLQKKS